MVLKLSFKTFYLYFFTNLFSLESILKKVSCQKLRLALGKAYAALGDYKTSVEQLHSAISLNVSETGPETEAAQVTYSP